MFFRLPDAAAALPGQVQALLDENDPFPESDLEALSAIAAATPDTGQGAELRRLALDVDDMIVQLRWHVGQAVLIWKAFPRLWEPASDADRLVAQCGMPSRAQLLLRPYARRDSRVFFDDLEERAPTGGSIGGWILHMMVDTAVDRCIAVFDRFACLLATATEVKFGNGKVYFRSRKLSVIREKIGPTLGDPLVALAEGEELGFLIDYRDGLAHRFRPTTWVSGIPRSDSYVDKQGNPCRLDCPGWGASELGAIAVLALHMTCQALPAVVSVCKQYAPRSAGPPERGPVDESAS